MSGVDWHHAEILAIVPAADGWEALCDVDDGYPKPVIAWVAYRDRDADPAPRLVPMIPDGDGTAWVDYEIDTIRRVPE